MTRPPATTPAGSTLRLFCIVEAFARHTVGHERSFIKIDEDVPVDRACLVACGVRYRLGLCRSSGSGWQPGEDVAIIIGVGGVGSGPQSREPVWPAPDASSPSTLSRVQA